MASELAFRARLIQREQRDLYDYWRARANGRPMPERADIDPVHLPRLLPGLSILDADNGLDTVRYRVAGTRVREIYGLEVTGRDVFSLDFRSKRDYWRSIYTQVLGGLAMQGAVRGPLANRDHLLLFWLRLPLGNSLNGVQKILGFDAAVPSRLARIAQDEEGPADAAPMLRAGSSLRQ